MKKLWQVWTAFAFCLAIGLIGMAWLTVRAVDLDRAEATARREAEQARQQTQLQERIALALWRMDWMLTPLIAQEATRPSFVYRPFLKSPADKSGKSKQPGVASPLLTQPPNYVVLNFDVSADNGWTSPQSPAEVDVPQAVAAGVSSGFMTGNRSKLETLGNSISFDNLLNLLPDALLPSLGQGETGSDGNTAGSSNNYAVFNDIGQTQTEGQQGVQVTQQTLTQQQEQSPIEQQRYAQPNMQGSMPPPQLAQQQGTPQSRGRQEWDRRNIGMQNVARSQRAQMMSNAAFMPAEDVEREGVSRPVWIDSKLILARRVVSGSDVRVQGCWLDWPVIKRGLQKEVADLFPEIELLPVTDGQPAPPGRLLATLPVQLSVPAVEGPAAGDTRSGTANLSAIRISLVIAWCCLLLGSVAIAIMLRSVLALSERRASFVSAVTHELRSPLTTFRMYAEMLAEGMVRDDQQRDRYLATLRQEADRLSHLVDNVLQYARLERGRESRRRVEIELKSLMQQTTERLPQRVQQAGMELHETLTPQDAKTVVLTDPAAVEQILFNLVDNSCKYASRAEDRRIHLHWSVGDRVTQVRVTDHGPGIQAEQAKKLFHPFSKSDQEAAQSAPGIGLGLALCRRLANDIGGKLLFDPGNGQGAAFLLELPLA